MTEELYYGTGYLHPFTKTISLTSEYMDGEEYFKINHYNQMNPFFMTIVSDSDHWMFVSSTGGMTCGRKNVDSALFPYYTDDKTHDSLTTTGAHAAFIVQKEEKAYLWRPFVKECAGVYAIERHLYKHTLGNKIIFEEINEDLGLIFRYEWKTSDRYGFVKESFLINNRDEEVHIRLLDGIRNILPYGITEQVQTTKSTLLDGYKRQELHPEAGLGIFTLSSILSDKAEPSESLKATTVWSKGLENPTYLLSEIQVDRFLNNQSIDQETDIKGRRGSYYVSTELTLEPKATKSWIIVASLNQDAAAVVQTKDALLHSDTLVDAVKKDIQGGTSRLKQLVYKADGWQLTANKKEGFRHFSNTLFNIMRGGIYADEYKVEAKDFIAFVEHWNKGIYGGMKDVLEHLPPYLGYEELIAICRATDNKDLYRLAMEYLPLTYSRRHGDPSRPWNKFSIDITKEDGSKNLKYEGNWRDIFQNWEALSMSYPGYVESIITKFVNASTADGYNPYRITKEGIDWEVLDLEDPWSNIGYWGDHQIIYLLKLMELSERFHPGKLGQLLEEEIFTYANVPYRIKDFDALLADPRNSIVFDESLHKEIEKKVMTYGSDAKLMLESDQTVKVNLLEKLMVTMLAKLSNFVPEGGIWLNTQRPEWNDANNALVGNGLSMVTLYYLYRYQTFMKRLIGSVGIEVIQISREVYELFEGIYEVFREHAVDSQTMTDKERFDLFKSLGRHSETYRKQIYATGFDGEKRTLKLEDLEAFLSSSLGHLAHTIHKNKREDGLYHAYNLIQFDKESCHITHLYEMLEGQVAVLSSKILTGEESIQLLHQLRKSKLYREDQKSYILYPNRELPKFLEKNIIPKEWIEQSAVLREEITKHPGRIITQDSYGAYHFNGSFRNAGEVTEAMIQIGKYSINEVQEVAERFTELFNHHAFTGRSGTFFKYEGLGCIYWHMVSKLLLATAEVYRDAYVKEGISETTEALRACYHEIKEGIGLEKNPDNYGAFPTDPYSHTPGFAGVQQPGMTGQVKEDFLARYQELGVFVENGQVRFEPTLLAASEFLTQEVEWEIPKGEEERLIIPKNGLGFTFCATPVIYQIADRVGIEVVQRDGQVNQIEGNGLDRDLSGQLFRRSSEVNRLIVYIDAHKLYR